MKFADFMLNHDKYHAYWTWSTFATAKKEGKIPAKYNDYFPDLCECGSENIISPNLKRCMCCNPRCYIKEACKLSEMMERFGFKGFGESTCATVLHSLRSENAARIKAINDNPNCTIKPLFTYDSYVEVIAINYNDYPYSLKRLAVGYDFACACQKMFSMSITFPQLVRNLGITSLDRKALNLFSSINSFDECIQCIEDAGGLRAFCSARGVQDTELISALYNAMFDIGIADTILRNSIRKEGIKNVDICITGHTIVNGSRYTKDKFIHLLNTLCIDSAGVQLYEFRLSTAMHSVPFIVYSATSSSAKFVAGKQRGTIVDQFGSHPVLIRAEDLCTLLKNVMSTWNTQLINEQPINAVLQMERGEFNDRHLQ